MPRKRKAAREFRRQLKRLTAPEELELILGPVEPGIFASDDARKHAYFLHREELLALLTPDCKPWAWDAYEGGAHA